LLPAHPPQAPLAALPLPPPPPGPTRGGFSILFILVTALVRPASAPVGQALHQGAGWGLWLQVGRDLLAPLALIVGVLGSIIAGVATPTEAAAIGAAGAMLLAALARRLRWSTLKACVNGTTVTTAMILFVAIGATCFAAIFKRLGGDLMIEEAVAAIAGGPYATLLVVMGLIFVLGFFLEWIEISYVVLPLFAPIIAGLDFGLGLSPDQTLVWFAILVAINLQTSFLTPPFGYALFYLKGIAPVGLTMVDIYRSVIPFVLLQLTGLALAIALPGLVTWLPQQLLWR
ncbi:MAG: TRAP transporter large permease subunit, partial [Candidatus Competibacterales bacterium]